MRRLPRQLRSTDARWVIIFYEALGFGVAERWEQGGTLMSVMIQAAICRLA
jgi:hypothetical protein